jgi:pimeloyl-ACP methyl ester carboxylesterase
VLIDGGVTQLDDQGASWDEMEQRLTPPDLAGMPVDEFVAKLRAWNADWGPSEQAISIFLDNFEIGEDECISPRLTRDRHMQIVSAIWDFKTYDIFQRVRCPVLMLPCRSAKPDSSGYLSAKERGVEKARSVLPHLQVQWMDHAIHDVPVQRPEAVARAITEFAAGLDGRNRSSI